jgi:hypothetical protein
MTALTLATRQNNSARPSRPLSWRRMVLVTWLQHQGTLIGVAALFGALAIYLGIEGLIIHHAWTVDMDCLPASSAACQAKAGSFASQWHSGATIAFPMQLLPALIGAFAGAPMLAREMETGTFRYTWTQGFGRTRWIIAKLALVGGPLALIAGAFGILTYWYFGPFVAQGQLIALDPHTFALECLAFPGWVLAAFAIGAFAGMLIRRVVPAMATTMAAVGGLGLAVGLYLRQHYLPPLIIPGQNGPAASAWTLGSWYTGRSGQTVPGYIVNTACPGPGPGNSTPGAPLSCLPQHGYSQWWSYQPASRYWPFQGIESGGLLLLAILLAAATIWLVRRRAT